MVISGVASGLIAVILFYETNGLINKVLDAVGLEPIAWQSEGTAGDDLGDDRCRSGSASAST